MTTSGPPARRSMRSGRERRRRCSIKFLPASAPLIALPPVRASGYERAVAQPRTPATVSTPIAQALAVLFIACSLVHAGFFYSSRSALVLFIICIVIAFTMENIGVATGCRRGICDDAMGFCDGPIRIDDSQSLDMAWLRW
jgi:uncharacterized membrane protein